MPHGQDGPISVTRLGSQSENIIRFILPARGFIHHPVIQSFHMNGSVIIHYADDKVLDISNKCELHRDHFQTAVLERLGRRGSKN